jgi:Fe-S-cluster containining protein
VSDENSGGRGRLAAGDFASWIGAIGQAFDNEGSSEVPCAGCTACCRSRQFVPVAPDEADTLAHIPPELLFPAPRLPEGHRVLGYDERGHCPMLVDDRCSIYEHRPRACRAYDCRIFAATGVDVGSEREAIGRRVARWQFTLETEAADAELEACRAAAAYLDDHHELWPDIARNPTQLATGAVAIHDLFSGPVRPDPARVGAELARRLGRADAPEAEGGAPSG